MGRGAKRSRNDSDGGEVVHGDQAPAAETNGQASTTSAPGTASSTSSSASQSPASKRRKVAAGSPKQQSQQQKPTVSVAAATSAAAAASSSASASSSGGQNGGSSSAASPTASSPDAASSGGGSLRRSPRLHRATELATPMRGKAKKSHKSVKFAGKAEVAMFMFGSPPIHQSQPRARFRSPAPNRKTPLRRFPMSPSPMKRRATGSKSPRGRHGGAAGGGLFANESKESNLATTSTARHTPSSAAAPSSPPPSTKPRNACSFPSPLPRSSRSSSSSSRRDDVPPPPPPAPVPVRSSGPRPMDLVNDSPPPPPPPLPPSDQAPPSTPGMSTLDTPLQRQQQQQHSTGGARRRSPRNRSRSLSPRSPRSPVIVSALLGGRSRSPSFRRASFSSTGSATPTQLHGGDGALMAGRPRSGSVSTPTRRSGKKSKKRQVLSAIDIAAEAVHRQFDLGDINEAREHLKREIQTVRKNTKLQLEKNGVRIFSVAELDKFVDDADDEVGVRTLVDRTEMQNLHKLNRSMLRDRLAEFYTEESIQTLTKKYMIKLLRDKYEEDMQETYNQRARYITRELESRGLPREGTQEKRIQTLREAMRVEVDTFAREEAELKAEMDQADSLTTLEAVRNALGQIRSDVLREQLKALSLNWHERANISPYELAQIYLFRLELYLAVIEKAQLRSAEIHPHNMSNEELEKEMKKRRIHIPDSLGERSPTEEWHDRVSRLNIALIEDKKKGPVKYDWGSAWFDPTDLAMLTREQMISELDTLGVSMPDMALQPEDVVLARLSQELIARSNKAVEDTLRTELRAFGKPDIRGDKDRLFRSLERTYYDHLQTAATPPVSPMSATSAAGGGGKTTTPTTPPSNRKPGDQPAATTNGGFLGWLTGGIRSSLGEVLR